MEYISAGLGSLILSLSLVLGALYMLTYRLKPAIKRAVRRCDAERQEVLDIKLEAPALKLLKVIESISDPHEQRRHIDTLYFDGKLPSYVTDGLRHATIIISAIVAAQERRASERETLLINVDRHRYAAA